MIVRNTIYYNVTTCRLVEIYKRFIGTYILHGQKYVDDGGRRFLQNVGKFLPEY
jgi:hypothetical protein